jgi:hypothetical protein
LDVLKDPTELKKKWREKQNADEKARKAVKDIEKAEKKAK